jgi:hypothetical protein
MAVGNYEVIHDDWSGSPGAFAATVDAPAGKVVLGGGAEVLSVDDEIQSFTVFGPSASGDAFRAEGSVGGSGTVQVRVYALCAEMC